MVAIGSVSWASYWALGDVQRSIGSIHACRGRIDEAFSWPACAYRQRDGQLPLIKADPCVGHLAGDPRYAAK